MTNKAFKAILEDIETGEAPLLRAGQRYARALNRFEAMSAQVNEMPAAEQTTLPDLGALWQQLFAGTQDASAGQADRSQSKLQRQPLTLAQLKKQLKRKPSQQELKRLRRQFALDHHPDRVPEAQRNVSARTLSIANDLIDCAMQNADLPYTER